MKNKHLLLFVGGIGIGVLGFYLYNRKKESDDTLEKGDKGKDVVSLQKLINSIQGTPVVEENGLYSKDVQQYVDSIMKDASVYKDGNLEKSFFVKLSEIYKL